MNPISVQIPQMYNALQRQSFSILGKLWVFCMLILFSPYWCLEFCGACFFFEILSFREAYFRFSPRNDVTLMELKQTVHGTLHQPGCVDWKNSGVRSEVRHKFDAINNCNYLIDILKTERTFKDIFHLVGIGGNNIVDGHNHYIRSLLSQIQRYHSTKLMAKILFKKRSVTDDELLLWMNNRLSIYQKMVKAMSKMHRNDTSLCNLGSNTVQMKANVRIPPTQLQPITRQTTQQMIGHR